MRTDDSGVIASVAQHLGAEFPDRSPLQILTAVLDAWDHAVGDPTGVARSARARLG
ncbi:MAG TPA: hypothetical protein VFZ64_00390 [Nocardioidaceae bacterium]